MITWWKRLNCPHRTGTTLTISYDGVAVVRCDGCGALYHVPLSGRRVKPGIIYRMWAALHGGDA